jgi:hypothetical protein
MLGFTPTLCQSGVATQGMVQHIGKNNLLITNVKLIQLEMDKE